jgi:hypothetical protein
MLAPNRLLSLCSLLLLAGMFIGEASAQGLPPPLVQYAAKFACGRVPPGTVGAVGGDADVVVGVYATSINIHNSQAKTPVKFRKKIVVANREDQPNGRIVFKDDVLEPDAAEYVDCPLIYRLLDLQPNTRHIEGFVVLQIPVTAGQPVLTLDVVGKYSARPFNGEVSSFDVVVYDAKRIND